MRRYTRRVNYYETDKMGVVHHSNYIRYFEEARTHFMEEAGYTYERLEREGIMSPVISVSCEYKKPVRYADTVNVDVYLVKMTRYRCAFRYEVTDSATGERRASGRSEHCYLNENGGIVDIQCAAPDFFKVFLDEVDGEQPQPREGGRENGKI